MRAHGIRGEVRVRISTDRPAEVFEPGSILQVSGRDPHVPDPTLPDLEVASARVHQDHLLVAFVGIDDRSEAELLKGRTLLREMDPEEELEADEVFQHELVGMAVETPEGESLGTVTEIFELEPAELLEIRGPRGTFLLPMARALIHTVDREGRRIVASPPEGLLDL